MSQIKNICVYCGSSGKVDEVFKEAARTLGKILGNKGIGLVYGGGHVGLMGIVADSSIEAGGEVLGVIPTHIAEKEVAHKTLSELLVVDTMHERKQIMVDRADAFVILPGGLGTMDEFFEIFTWWQLGLHDKPIAIVNVAEYWTPLLDLIRHIVDHKFARAEHLEHLCIVDRVEDVLAALENAPKEHIDPKTKWM